MKTINWSINIDETEFQELFELYWNAGVNSAQRLFVIEELNKYAYFYLISRPQTDFDMASDFFLEIITNTRELLEQYEPSYYISFLVYFTSRIKRRLFNYRIKSYERKKYENVNEFYEFNPERYAESVFESASQYAVEDDRDIKKITEACLSKLNSDEEVSIKLYYGFHLNLKNFRFLVKNKNKNRVFLNFREYLSYINRKHSSEKKQRESVFHKLYIVNIKLRDNHNETYCQRRERLLTSLNMRKSAAPLRFIADILEVNITNVYRKIRRGRKKLEQLLQCQLYFKFEDKETSTEINPDIKKAA